MNPENLEQEILELLDAYQDGPWDSRQQARLNDLLQREPEARRIFLHEQWLAATLHQEVPSSLPGSSSLLSRPESPAIGSEKPAASTSFLRFRSGWGWGAAAALFVIGLTLGWTLKWPATTKALAEESDDGVALLVESVDTAWLGQRQPRSGNILSAGRVHLASGMAQIEFYSGARLLLQGPVELDLRSAHEAVCHAGRVRAAIPPQARGFRIETPQCRVIDQGGEFGVEVDATIGSRIHVFEGAVELHPLDSSARGSTSAQRVSPGQGLLWTASGATIPLDTATPERFASFDQIRVEVESQNHKRYAEWLQWNQTVARDPRVAARYDFENKGQTLRDSGPGAAHGSIIGCEFTNGRWANKGALEFKRPGDRVRVSIPGNFDAITLSAWIRVDASSKRPLGLLLTDGYRPGFPHWQIARDGQLRLGIRVTDASGHEESSGYGSPLLFTPRQMGVWSFVTTVYDNAEGITRHFFNGSEVASEKTIVRQSIQIGPADIGNWGMPLRGDSHPVRNFIGRMDELTVWNTALKAQEIRAIYEKTRP